LSFDPLANNAMKAPLLAGIAGLLPLVTPSAQTPGSPGGLGSFRDAPERLLLGTVTLVPLSGGPGVPHATIQAAVDAAQEGDTVLLSDGYFLGPGNRNVLITGKNVVIRSSNGAETSIVDCRGLGRGFHLLGPIVTSATLIQGITVANGSAVQGGAIYCEADSAPTIESCRFIANEAGLGGAIHALVSGASDQIVIRSCTFEGNEADHGPSVFVDGALVDRCKVLGNTAELSGAAYIVSGVIRNSLIAQNSVGTNGGGVFIEGPNATITGCTIVDNEARTGGGVYANTAVGVSIDSCILWGNLAFGIPNQFFQFAFSLQFSAPLRFCAIEGGLDGLVGGPAQVLFDVEGLVAEPPEFVGPSSGVYALTPTSPCVDSGGPSYIAETNEGDIDNEPRVNGTLDIGADEYWDGLALSYVSPGRAGQPNWIQARGARPYEPVFFFVALSGGLTRYSFGSCPALCIEMEDPMFLGARQSDHQGVSRYSQHVSSAVAGASLLFRSIAFDPNEARAGCAASNLVHFRYR